MYGLNRPEARPLAFGPLPPPCGISVSGSYGFTVPASGTATAFGSTGPGVM